MLLGFVQLLCECPGLKKAKKDRKKKKYVEREIWPKDFYENEVVRIVTDYLTLGSKILVAAPERAKIVGQ